MTTPFGVSSSGSGKTTGFLSPRVSQGIRSLRGGRSGPHERIISEIESLYVPYRSQPRALLYRQTAAVLLLRAPFSSINSPFEKTSIVFTNVIKSAGRLGSINAPLAEFGDRAHPIWHRRVQILTLLDRTNALMGHWHMEKAIR